MLPRAAGGIPTPFCVRPRPRELDSCEVPRPDIVAAGSE